MRKILVVLAVCAAALVPGFALAAPSLASGCNIAQSYCVLTNQYGEIINGSVHTEGLHTGQHQDTYTFSPFDGVWGSLSPHSDNSLCWQNDIDINGQINLEGCQAQDQPCGSICHRQLWWMQSASGHIAIKNYFEGTGPAVWGASTDGVFIEFTNTYNNNSKWDAG